eukprot:11500231-Alexandrium_andersonii.AAC.1
MTLCAAVNAHPRGRRDYDIARGCLFSSTHGVAPVEALSARERRTRLGCNTRERTAVRSSTG